MLELVQLGGRGVFLGLALVGATLLASPVVDANKSPVSLGRVSSRVPKRADVKRQLESAVKSELAQIDLTGIRASERYVLSASLMKMDTVTEGEQSETTCVVSATLTREKSGALHAVVQGRARATDAREATRAAESAALRAAVHSAIGRVPEAIR